MTSVAHGQPERDAFGSSEKPFTRPPGKSFEYPAIGFSTGQPNKIVAEQSQVPGLQNGPEVEADAISHCVPLYKGKGVDGPINLASPRQALQLRFLDQSSSHTREKGVGVCTAFFWPFCSLIPS